MQLPWVAGSIGFWLGFDAWQDGDITAATNTVTLWVVGIVGVISFLRHAVFHRSDAKRMGWDYGKRNDFQLEVGFANLAWGALRLDRLGTELEPTGARSIAVGVRHLHGSGRCTAPH